MVCNIQNQYVCRLRPASGILNKEKTQRFGNWNCLQVRGGSHLLYSVPVRAKTCQGKLMHRIKLIICDAISCLPLAPSVEYKLNTRNKMLAESHEESDIKLVSVTWVFAFCCVYQIRFRGFRLTQIYFNSEQLLKWFL
jgi:hypothetical protein